MPALCYDAVIGSKRSEHKDEDKVQQTDTIEAAAKGKKIQTNKSDRDRNIYGKRTRLSEFSNIRP